MLAMAMLLFATPGMTPHYLPPNTISHERGTPKPLFIGEVASLEAAVCFASPRSMEVVVTVTGENLITGHKRITNKATLW